jgi:hypothetical protein
VALFLALPLFLIRGEGSFTPGFMVRLGRVGFRGCWFLRFPGPLLCLGPRGQESCSLVGKCTCSLKGSFVLTGFEDGAGLCHRGRDDLGINDFRSKALMEEMGV